MTAAQNLVAFTPRAFTLRAFGVGEVLRTAPPASIAALPR
jgi:hypothetical protein